MEICSPGPGHHAQTAYITYRHPPTPSLQERITTDHTGKGLFESFWLEKVETPQAAEKKATLGAEKGWTSLNQLQHHMFL